MFVELPGSHNMELKQALYLLCPWYLRYGKKGGNLIQHKEWHRQILHNVAESALVVIKPSKIISTNWN